MYFSRLEMVLRPIGQPVQTYMVADNTVECVCRNLQSTLLSAIPSNLVWPLADHRHYHFRHLCFRRSHMGGITIVSIAEQSSREEKLVALRMGNPVRLRIVCDNRFCRLWHHTVDRLSMVDCGDEQYVIVAFNPSSTLLPCKIYQWGADETIFYNHQILQRVT